MLIELAMRRRIALVKDPNRRRVPLTERLVEVIDERQTGETILDEALKMMKAQGEEKLGINNWIDLLSGTFRGLFFDFFSLDWPAFKPGWRLHYLIPLYWRYDSEY
jgi:hypothetical protein